MQVRNLAFNAKITKYTNCYNNSNNTTNRTQKSYVAMFCRNVLSQRSVTTPDH